MYKMKIVLLEDVKSLGKKGDIVEASEGYARNFILPKKLGVEATKSNLNTLKLQKANEEKVALEKLEAAKELAKKIEESEITLSIKAGKDGRTYGSVSTKEIYEALLKQRQLEVDKKKIVVGESIKTFGTHNVSVKLHPKVQANLKVKVVEE
jgi:ribosomal protein L9